MDRYRMDVSYRVDANIQQAPNFFSGDHADVYGQGGNIDFFISDADNFGDYDDGNSFKTFGLDERADMPGA